MRLKKIWESVSADLIRLFQVDLTSEKSSDSHTHGCMVIATKKPDIDLPRVIRGARSSSSFSASAENQGREIYERLGKAVGTGAKGTVGLWRCKLGGQLVAVKIFHNPLPFEAKSRYDKEVLAEYNIGKTLNHGNIVGVLELLQVQGRWLQVMEYVPFDLFATVASRTMSLEENSCIFRQIVAGIEYMHAKGVAHRDIKLDNFRLDQHGIVKIIDFGTAVHWKSHVLRCVDGREVIGSDPYIAPEVFSPSIVSYDAKALDVWSIAIIFCTMLRGRFPWAVARPENTAFGWFCQRLLEKAPMKQPSDESQINQTTFVRNDGEVASDSTDNNKVLKHASEVSNFSRVVVQQPEHWSYLPARCHNVIGGMLEISPSHRFKIQMVLQDSWVQEIPFCYERESGKPVVSGQHEHHLRE